MKNQKFILLILASLNFTHILDFMIMMPLGNYLMPYFNISPRQFTFLVGAYTFSAAISGFMAAFFVDKYDRKKVLLICFTGFLIGTIACGLAPTYGLLLFSRTFAGVFGGVIGAQVLSIIADIFPYEERGKAMGSVMSAFAVASTIGVPFALYLAKLISWHAPFLLVGILGILLFPFIVKYVPSMTHHIQKKEEQTSIIETLKLVARDPVQSLALLFSGLMMMGHFIIIPFVNPFLEFNAGFSKTLTPLIYLAGGTAAFFAANILGRLADKYGKLIVFTICVLLSLVVVVCITNLPALPFSIVLVLFAFWFTVSTGRGVTAQAMVSNVVPPAQRGSFMSFNSSVQQLGTSAASLVAGFIVVSTPDGKIQHYDWLGYLSIAVLSLCLILARYLFGKMDKKITVPAAV